MGPTPKFLIVDDDSVFCELMVRTGRGMPCFIKTINSLGDLYSIGEIKNFDLVILDYHLKSWKGTEIAQYVETFFPHIPAMIVTADLGVSRKSEWSPVINSLVYKKEGPLTILRKALELVERRNFLALCDDSRLRQTIFQQRISESGSIPHLSDIAEENSS